MTMRATIIFVVLCSIGIYAFADSEARPWPVVYASPSGNHYFRLIPAYDSKEKIAEGFLYRVAAGKDELVYRTEGWYAFTVLVSNDGKHMARTGPWPRSGSPPEKTIAVVFYRDGAPIRTYYVSDLIEDLSSLRHSMSHYSWGRPMRWANGGMNNQVEVETVENRTITFNIESAKIVQ